MRRVLLWVDDHHENNQAIVDVAFKEGIIVMQARSSKVALEWLRSPTGRHLLARPHASVRVITSMGRTNESASAGIELIDQVRRSGLSVPAMVYTSEAAVATAARLRRERGLLNVVETDEEEKATDFALFHDAFLDNQWTSRAPPPPPPAAAAAAAGAKPGGAAAADYSHVEFPSKDEEVVAAAAPAAAAPAAVCDKWKASVETLAEMGYCDIARNKRLLEARVKRHPDESNTERITAVVAELCKE